MKNIKAEVAKPRKVALYASIDSNYVSTWDVPYERYDEFYNPLPDGQLRELPIRNMVRITEPVEVQFRPISNDEAVAKAVESLNETERDLRRELNQKLAEIAEKRNQLLALTHEGSREVAP